MRPLTFRGSRLAAAMLFVAASLTSVVAHPGPASAAVTAVYSNTGCTGGKMKIPTHLVVDQTTRVLYTADPRCGTVFAFNADTGAFRSDIVFDWASALGAGKVAVPRGIDQDAAGNIYVAE